MRGKKKTKHVPKFILKRIAIYYLSILEICKILVFLYFLALEIPTINCIIV